MEGLGELNNIMALSMCKYGDSVQLFLSFLRVRVTH